MKTIAVFGSAIVLPDESDYIDSRNVGRALAEAGYAVMTGGYMGIMAGASQGACEVDGHVIGITCEQIEKIRPGGTNEWVKEDIKYATLDERLRHLIHKADGYVIMPGGLGTLNELVMVWELMRVGEIPKTPIVCYGRFWERMLSEIIESRYMAAKSKDLLYFVETPQQVIEIFDETKVK